MTTFIWSHPIARKPHTCTVCYRQIAPGEKYARMAGLDCGEVWTSVECAHCHWLTGEYVDSSGEFEYDQESVREWAVDWAPITWESMLAGWRSPDGDLLPVPGVLA